MCTVMNSVRTFTYHITRLDMTGKRVRLPYCRIFVLLMHGGFLWLTVCSLCCPKSVYSEYSMVRLTDPEYIR